MKVTPTHSPPAGISQESYPFIRPVEQTTSSVQFPGSGSSASLHQPTSQTQTSIPTSNIQFPGTGSSASQHQPASQTQTSIPATDTQFPGTGSSASQHQPSSKTRNIPPTSTYTLPGSGSSVPLHQPASKVHPNRPATSGSTGLDSSGLKQKSANKHKTHQPEDIRPGSFQHRPFCYQAQVG